MADLNDTSVYPNDIDGYSTLALRQDGVHEIVAADHNRLRNTIVKIEQELGPKPSGTWATVRARLDSIGDAASLITDHLLDTSDAHDASAISLLDSADFYSSDNVEDVIAELAAALPVSIDNIGEDNSNVPNSGIPNFVSRGGTRGVFNTGVVGNIMTKTQPTSITGLHIIEIGESNGDGTGTLTMPSENIVQWTAPGDTIGAETQVSGMSVGDTVTVSSGTTTKKIRLARTSTSFPATALLPLTDTFEIYKLAPSTGAYSANSVGIVTSNYITRTAASPTGTSREQFMIGGMVFPADKGTLVLQRKLRGSSAFGEIAVLDLESNFTESLRSTGQPVYVPSMTNFDTITLFDRLPMKNDYSATLDADGNQVYTDFDISSDFATSQVAKYLIPASNTDLVGGELDAPTGVGLTEINNKVSAYRMVHFKSGATEFSGDPDATDIFSMWDPLETNNDGDNNVRMSNVYVDTNTSRPTISRMVLSPEVPSVEAQPKFVSGVNYYNSADDKFHLELRTGTDVFSNAYLETGILTMTSDALTFPSGDGYGASVDVTQLTDDGYLAFSDDNVPTFTDFGYYIINSTTNDARRLTPATNDFSVDARVSATINDPFGSGTQFDAYGYIKSSETPVKILVNSYDRYRATDTIEYFTDESRRVGVTEEFSFPVEREQYTHSYVDVDGYSLAIWDNRLPLATGGSGTNGSLQCGGRFTDNSDVPGLIYPQDDYSSGVAPAQTNATDHSTGYEVADEYIYQRLFNLGRDVNSARLRVVSGGDRPISFNDIYAGNAARPVKISVKIPGTGTNATGWLDIGKLAQTGAFEDGDGALSGAVSGSAGDFTVPFTFQYRNTTANEGMIAVRVSYFSSKATEARKKIMTRLELLSPA